MNKFPDKSDFIKALVLQKKKSVMRNVSRQKLYFYIYTNDKKAAT